MEFESVYPADFCSRRLKAIADPTHGALDDACPRRGFEVSLQGAHAETR